jgi:hypothetical protein
LVAVSLVAPELGWAIRVLKLRYQLCCFRALQSFSQREPIIVSWLDMPCKGESDRLALETRHAGPVYPVGGTLVDVLVEEVA